jgi:hypothetical protein
MPCQPTIAARLLGNGGKIETIYYKIVGVQSRNKCSLWNVERKEWAGTCSFNPHTPTHTTHPTHPTHPTHTTPLTHPSHIPPPHTHTPHTHTHHTPPPPSHLAYGNRVVYQLCCENYRIIATLISFFVPVILCT